MSPETQALLEAAAKVAKAFGAPGDYGYGTKEGDALFALAKARAAFPAAPTNSQPQN